MPEESSQQQMQRLVGSVEADPHMSAVKQEVDTIDLETVQAQITDFGVTTLSQGALDQDNVLPQVIMVEKIEYLIYLFFF